MTARWLVPLVLTAALACKPKAPPTVGPAPVDSTPSTTVVDSLWQAALKNFRMGGFTKASEQFQRVLLEFQPGDPRMAKAHFFLGECYFATKSQLQAVREFRKVSDDYPSDPMAPDALYRAGDAYSTLWGPADLDPTYGKSALATYTELLNRYPNSPAAARARQQVQVLNDKFALKEWETARYYLRQKAYDSAILYMKALVAAYPNTPSAQQALVQLVTTYRKLGYPEDANEMCGALQQYHPDTKNLDRLCPPAGG